MFLNQTRFVLFVIQTKKLIVTSEVEMKENEENLKQRQND